MAKAAMQVPCDTERRSYMEENPFWDLLPDTVEGRVRPASFALVDGKPGFSAQAIPRKAPPNLRLLADVLRSENQLPSKIRKWLADLLDPDASTERQLKLSKRKRGAKTKSISKNWDVAEFVEELLHKGATRQRAIGAAMDKYRLSKSSIEAALSSLKKAREIHSRIACEEAFPNEASSPTN
jgi:hypothetical protein